IVCFLLLLRRLVATSKVLCLVLQALLLLAQLVLGGLVVLLGETIGLGRKLALFLGQTIGLLGIALGALELIGQAVHGSGGLIGLLPKIGRLLPGCLGSLLHGLVALGLTLRGLSLGQARRFLGQLLLLILQPLQFGSFFRRGPVIARQVGRLIGEFLLLLS